MTSALWRRRSASFSTQFPNMRRLAADWANGSKTKWIAPFCGLPIILSYIVFDPTRLAASIFACFLTTYLTSSGDKHFGFWRSLTPAANRFTGFLGATKSFNYWPGNFIKSERNFMLTISKQNHVVPLINVFTSRAEKSAKAGGLFLAP